MALTPYPMTTYTLPPMPAASLLREVRAARPARPAKPTILMRADAAYLVAASIAGFAASALGAGFAGVGFGEAHELALVAGILMWMASPRRCWHLSAAAVHALLGAANLAHWDALAAGNEAIAVATTAIHATLVVLQVAAAARTR
jgi:hypothetical protein